MEGFQVIRGVDGQPLFAVVPWAEFLAMGGTDMSPISVEEDDDEDIHDVMHAIRNTALSKSAGRLTIPNGVVQAISRGDNPLRAWRLHAGLSQQELARVLGIIPNYLSQLERGERTGSLSLLERFAGAVGTNVATLVQTRSLHQSRHREAAVDSAD